MGWGDGSEGIIRPIKNGNVTLISMQGKNLKRWTEEKKMAPLIIKNGD